MNMTYWARVRLLRAKLDNAEPRRLSNQRATEAEVMRLRDALKVMKKHHESALGFINAVLKE